jgi:hypothetical protein
VRECCEEFLYSFKKKIIIIIIIMSSKGETSNKEGQAESPLMLRAMQQQFERMDMMFNEIRDRMDRQDAVIATWREERPQRGPYVRRQARRALVDDSDGDHEDEFEGEKAQASLNDRFVPRGERRGRGFRTGLRWRDGTDGNLGNIKNEDTVVPREKRS